MYARDTVDSHTPAWVDSDSAVMHVRLRDFVAPATIICKPRFARDRPRRRYPIYGEHGKHNGCSCLSPFWTRLVLNWAPNDWIIERKKKQKTIKSIDKHGLNRWKRIVATKYTKTFCCVRFVLELPKYYWKFIIGKSYRTDDSPGKAGVRIERFGKVKFVVYHSIHLIC